MDELDWSTRSPAETLKAEDHPFSGDSRSKSISHVHKEPAEWLTREEWNACYFLGQEAFFQEGVQCGVCEQVGIGMERLLTAGYEFQKLQVGNSGRLEPRGDWPKSGEHESSCGEVSAGSFDDIGRAREALRWFQDHAPGVATAWLEKLLAVYDRAHGEPLGSRPESARPFPG